MAGHPSARISKEGVNPSFRISKTNSRTSNQKGHSHKRRVWLGRTGTTMTYIKLTKSPQKRKNTEPLSIHKWKETKNIGTNQKPARVFLKSDCRKTAETTSDVTGKEKLKATMRSAVTKSPMHKIRSCTIRKILIASHVTKKRTGRSRAPHWGKHHQSRENERKSQK